MAEIDPQILRHMESYAAGLDGLERLIWPRDAAKAATLIRNEERERCRRIADSIWRGSGNTDIDRAVEQIRSGEPGPCPNDTDGDGNCANRHCACRRPARPLGGACPHGYYSDCSACRPTPDVGYDRSDW